MAKPGREAETSQLMPRPRCESATAEVLHSIPARTYLLSQSTRTKLFVQGPKKGLVGFSRLSHAEGVSVLRGNLRGNYSQPQNIPVWKRYVSYSTLLQVYFV